MALVTRTLSRLRRSPVGLVFRQRRYQTTLLDVTALKYDGVWSERESNRSKNRRSNMYANRNSLEHVKNIRQTGENDRPCITRTCSSTRETKYQTRKSFVCTANDGVMFQATVVS